MKLKSISATSYSTYEVCPYKWSLKYKSKLLTMPNPAFIVGTAVHNALENYHNGMTVDNVMAELRLELLNKEETTEVELDRFGMARNMVEAYIRNPVDLETIQTEYKFILPVPELTAPLFGFVDRIVVPGFVEYKTSVKMFKLEDIDNIQTDIYSYVGWKNRGFMPLVTYCILHKTKSKKPDYKPQIMEITRTEDDMVELIRKLKTFEENIEREEFHATPSYKCRWCDYSFSCKHNKYGS